MWRRVTKNYTVRINSSAKPGDTVIVTMRHGRSVIKFSARVILQGRYTYVTIPKAIRDAYGIRPHDEVKIISVSLNGTKEV